MAGRLDAIWIATLALSVGLVGIFITWKSSIKWITSFLVLFHWLLMFLQKFLCLLFILICFPLSCRLSAQFFPQLPHGCFACCCLNMSFIHIPLLRPKTLPAVCAVLVNPWMSRNISAYFWRCDVFWDLREIAYNSCYYTQKLRLFCTSDCWHCQNKAAMEICKFFKI